jgi:acyl-CoA synthetase (AMP-forming)/AMP-acid ligase II
VVPGGGSFSAARTLRALESHGATHLFEVTANCQRLADHAIARRRRLPASLRHVLVGAAPVRGACLRRVQDVLPPGARAWCVYGMTEILPVAAVTLDAKLAYEGAGDLVGAPVPGVSVRTTDAGELLVSGPHLFTGCLGAPAASAGHEHATGDQARLDGGRIVLLGRVKDMIIRREHNIYPGLHEPLIERLPGVRRCALVGVWDDAIADERVVLAVEPERWGDDERFVRSLWRALRAGPARIDDAAQPDHIMLLALPESGRAHKVDRQAVRELARARLGLGEAACASR